MAILVHKRRHRFSAPLLCAALLTVGLPSINAPAFAQQSQSEREEEDRRRQRQTLSERSGRAITEALNLANEEPPQTAAAIQRLDQLLGRNLPPYDEATALEIRGQLHFQNENVPAALRDLQRALDLDVLPSDREKGLIRGIASLLYASDDYRGAIRFMENYVRDFPDEVEANDWFIIAGSYAQLDDYRGARRPAENALRMDQQAGNRNEQFYSILNLIYSELNLNSERLDLLEQMVSYFPNNSNYWSQLAFLYNNAGRNADALAVLEISYRAGLITEEDKIIALVQFYYDQDNPYRGAKLLAAEMQAGNVDRDLANLELLGQLWTAAREQEEAIAVLSEAAPLRDDGRLYYQLGQSFLADEQYSRAITNLRQAIRRGGLSDRETGNAYVLIGTALFQQDSDTKESRQASRTEFVRAARYPTSAAVANSWIEYIDTIESTLERQAAVELSQAEERWRRRIERCQTILDVISLGGRTEVPEEQLAECRALQARVADEGVEPIDLAREELGLVDEETADEETEEASE